MDEINKLNSVLTFGAEGAAPEVEPVVKEVKAEIKPAKKAVDTEEVNFDLTYFFAGKGYLVKGRGNVYYFWNPKSKKGLTRGVQDVRLSELTEVKDFTPIYTEVPSLKAKIKR